MSILMAEYDFDTAMAVKQEEAYTKGISLGREEGISLGREEGAYQNKLETAQILLTMGLSPVQVAQGTKLPLETVERLQEN